LNHFVGLKATNGTANTVTLVAATEDHFSEAHEYEIIKFMLSKEAGFMSTSFQEGVLRRCCTVGYELLKGRTPIQQFLLTKHSVNCATTADLLPYVDKYLAAVEKRARASEESRPIEASAKKAVREPTAQEERIALVTDFCASVDDAELEVLQNLLTAEIEKRKKPPSSGFVDMRKIGSPPPAASAGGAASSSG